MGILNYAHYFAPVCVNGDIRLRGDVNDTEGRDLLQFNMCDNLWGTMFTAES